MAAVNRYLQAIYCQAFNEAFAQPPLPETARILGLVQLKYFANQKMSCPLMGVRCNVKSLKIEVVLKFLCIKLSR
jgi:hypothetical protein